MNDEQTKSTIDEIRERFDNDVERFSNLDTGQVAVADSPRHMQLVAQAVAAKHPNLSHMLDVGCGAGNYTLSVLSAVSKIDQGRAKPDVACDLLDVSQPMLDRAEQRVREATSGPIATIRHDIRKAELPQATYDTIIAAQCLHHLRDDSQWHDTFSKLFNALKPGGSFWISDSLSHEDPAIAAMMWNDWGDYLVRVKDEAYRDQVLAYVEKEDTPRSLTYQLDLMRQIGFRNPDVLHVNMRFGSFGGIKPVV